MYILFNYITMKLIASYEIPKDIVDKTMSYFLMIVYSFYKKNFLKKKSLNF